MAKLENITIDKLHHALEEVEDKKATQRLMLAILYKHEASVPLIAKWFDLYESKIYRWFSEMEEKPLMEAIHDQPPPGRPPKLTGDERRRLERTLRMAPHEVGYEAPEWTTELVQTYLHEEFNVEYTLRHVRRVMKQTRRSP